MDDINDVYVSFDKLIRLLETMFVGWQCNIAYYGVSNKPGGDTAVKYVAVLVVDRAVDWTNILKKDIDKIIKPLLSKSCLLEFDQFNRSVIASVDFMPVSHDAFILNESNVYDLNITHWQRVPFAHKEPSQAVVVSSTMFCYLVIFCGNDFEFVNTNFSKIYIPELSQFYWENQFATFEDASGIQCVKVCLETTPYTLYKSFASVALIQIPLNIVTILFTFSCF